jgi:gluconate 5-dehydrogenase
VTEGPLAGKTCIVTGGGTGIGRAIAHAFAASGGAVVVAGRRLERCEEVRRELEAGGSRAFALKCDVTEPDDVNAMVEQTLARFGVIDVLVNCAGTPGAARPVLELDLDRWNRTLAVNLTGILLCAQAVARQMVRNGGGRIINVASVGALKVLPESADYCASKAATLQLTKSLALELSRYGIRVNAICPGFIDTEFAPDLLDDVRNAATRRVPAGRLGSPQEVAALALFLASASPDYLTGTSLVVDGGLLLK